MPGNSDGAVSQSQAESDLAFFYAFMDNSPAVCFMKNAEGKFVYVNRTFEKLFDVTSEKILFTTDHDWFAPVVAKQNVDNDRKVMETGLPLQITEVLPTPDETHMVWRVTKFPFEDSAGNAYVGGVAVDITQIHETKRDLAETVSILEAQKAMLAQVNCELETELSALRSRV